MPTFEVHGAWLVELRDARGRVMLTAAERGHAMSALGWIASVRAAALGAGDHHEIRHHRAGGSYFVLKDAWDDVYATSPLFGNDRECERALYYALQTVPTASVVETASRPQSAANLGSRVNSISLDVVDREVA